MRGLCLISRIALVTVLVGLFPFSAASAETTFREFPLEGGSTLRYALVLPEDFDPAQTYPILLALPPGRQDERMVEAGLGRYWGERASALGWIVISPAAPGGVSFIEGSERHIPRLLEQARAEFHPEGGGFHLAGASNGGRGAFRVALEHPEDFLSLTVLPGFPPTADDFAHLDRLAGIPVRLAVGGADVQWIGRMEETVARLREFGGDVELEIFAGEGHVPPSLDGGAVMERLEALRAAVGDVRRAAITEVLDTFHHAAAKADGAAYFTLFADDAVFLGTDPGERWGLEQFRAFAEPYFARGQGWLYEPVERHIEIAPGGDVAWFDETLDNAKYGLCRGTGVLLREGETWKIAQYNLTLVIPNDAAADVVEVVRAASKPSAEGGMAEE